MNLKNVNNVVKNKYINYYTFNILMILNILKIEKLIN